MDSALTMHRLHFAFTATFHYLFPQLTMGLALLIVALKTMGLKTNDPRFHQAARFWMRIFGVGFTIGVVSGIPMEFQFGTNWARFSKAAGAVIGQPLALEGVYSFFLESSFLGLFLFGEKMLKPAGHWLAAVMVLAGSWLSGFFIIATDAWMQHPVAYSIGPNGEILLNSLWELLFHNPWTVWQYAHNMVGSVATASFVMAAVGAFYLISNQFVEQARIFIATGVIGAIFGSLFLLATGDGQGRNIGMYQPVTLAATEGLFDTQRGAPLAILGQPDTNTGRLDNPLLIPRVLSFITYRHWSAEVKGLNEYPREEWPDNIPLLYYSFHIMVGLGTIFIAISLISGVWLWRGRLYDSKPLLWILMLSFPFPYIANTAGWITAEVGRQPWVIYGVMRTANGDSTNVSAGNALFTLLGFMGVYTVLGILFLFLVYRELARGPEAPVEVH